MGRRGGSGEDGEVWGQKAEAQGKLNTVSRSSSLSCFQGGCLNCPMRKRGPELQTFPRLEGAVGSSWDGSVLGGQGPECPGQEAAAGGSGRQAQPGATQPLSLGHCRGTHLLEGAT